MNIFKRKKRWIVLLAVVACLAILLTFVGPYVVLLAARQPAVEDS